MSTAPTVRSDTMPQAIPVNEGRRRVVVEGVQPTVDGGRFPAKQAVGDEMFTHADHLAQIAFDEMHNLAGHRLHGDLDMKCLA